MTFKLEDFVVIEQKVDDPSWTWIVAMDSLIGCVGVVVDGGSSSNLFSSKQDKVYPESNRLYRVKTPTPHPLPGLPDCHTYELVYRKEALRLATPDEIRGHQMVVNLSSISNVTLQGK